MECHSFEAVIRTVAHSVLMDFQSVIGLRCSEVMKPGTTWEGAPCGYYGHRKNRKRQTGGCCFWQLDRDATGQFLVLLSRTTVFYILPRVGRLDEVSSDEIIFQHPN